jgi:hypothetical protein
VGIGAANQKLGVQAIPECLPDAPRGPQSNHRAREWGLGWPELISGDWRAAISGEIHQQKCDQSGIAPECGRFIIGSPSSLMYMS